MTTAQIFSVLALVGLAAAPAAAERDGVRRALHLTSVEVQSSGCSGALAESRQLIVTAAHCVENVQRVIVRFTTGWRRAAWVVAVDEVADQAVLFLEDPVPLQPLRIVRRRQIPGTVLYFEGHPARPRFQSARLDKVGRCSSLPALPNALFTSVNGTPGDSGAPIVDAAARIVGLVHGGARCHIATPADTLLRLVDGVLGRDPRRVVVEPARGVSRPPAPPTTS